MKTEHIPIIKPIKDYRGFIISEEQYVEEPHPQYNYLGFKAENDVGQHVEVTFHDIDMRIKTHDELLDIFLKRVDQFINDIGGIYRSHNHRLIKKGLALEISEGMYNH